jgi:hypothetical protein
VAPRTATTQFAAFVKAHPGLRIEQINKELGTTTKDMALPIRKLIAEGMISANLGPARRGELQVGSVAGRDSGVAVWRSSPGRVG